MWAFGVTLFAMLTRQMPFTDSEENAYAFREEVLRGEWNRELLKDCGCSDTAQDLLYQLFKVNPEERLSAENALNHRFFMGVTSLVESTKTGGKHTRVT